MQHSPGQREVHLAGGREGEKQLWLKDTRFGRRIEERRQLRAHFFERALRGAQPLVYQHPGAFCARRLLGPHRAIEVFPRASQRALTHLLSAVPTGTHTMPVLMLA